MSVWSDGSQDWLANLPSGADSLTTRRSPQTPAIRARVLTPALRCGKGTRAIHASPRPAMQAPTTKMAVV
jgi:hypothetical protein